ncbi:MAG: COX15/CtaA family protein [Candidatus Acidiferrales bacterium]
MCSCTVVLLVAGALVTSNNAADSVPDWPLAYGRLIPPMVGGIRYEYVHRVIAGLVAILTLALAVWIARVETRRWMRRLGWTALGLVVAQAVLGGVRVLEGHAAISATAHAILAQVFFITLISIALFTSGWWQSQTSSFQDTRSPRVITLAMWTTAAIFVQLVLGASFRHGAFGILPHLIGAAVVAVMVIWAAAVAKRRFARVPAMRRAVIWLHSTFGTQIILGGFAYWAIVSAPDTTQPGLAYVLLSVAHVAVGALLLASSLLFTLVSYRLVHPVAEGAPAVEPLTTSAAAQGTR